MPNITLYHASPSRSSIVLWMLEEVGPKPIPSAPSTIEAKKPASAGRKPKAAAAAGD